MVRPALIISLFELDRAIDASHEGPVMIFKHSLACAVSASGYQIYRDFLARKSPGDGLYAVVEVQNARDVSDAVTSRTGVRHETPQVLLVRDGEVTWSASHWDISREALEGALVR